MSNSQEETYDAEMVNPESLINNYVPSENAIKIFGRARTIKFLAFFHGILNLFNALFNFWFYCFFAILCFLGYKGAKEYNYNYTIYYMFYNILDIIAQIFIIYYVSHNRSDMEINNEQLGVYYLLQGIFLFVNFWILCIVYNFIRDLKNVSPTDLNFLRGGGPLQNIHVVWI